MIVQFIILLRNLLVENGNAKMHLQKIDVIITLKIVQIIKKLLKIFNFIQILLHFQAII